MTRRIQPYAPSLRTVSLHVAADVLGILAALLLALRVALRVLDTWHAERVAGQRSMYFLTIGRIYAHPNP